MHMGLAQCENGPGPRSLTVAYKILTKYSHVMKILYGIYC